MKISCSPVYPSEDTEGGDGEVEDEAELTLEKVEEDMMADYEEEEDDEENILHMEELKDLTVSVCSFKILNVWKKFDYILLIYK